MACGSERSVVTLFLTRIYKKMIHKTITAASSPRKTGFLFWFLIRRTVSDARPLWEIFPSTDFEERNFLKNLKFKTFNASSCWSNNAVVTMLKVMQLSAPDGEQAILNLTMQCSVQLESLTINSESFLCNKFLYSFMCATLATITLQFKLLFIDCRWQ